MFRVNKENHDWKKTTFPFLWKKIVVETEKINKLLPNSPTDNITNKLIYAGMKLADGKIGVPLKIPNMNMKIKLD